jgi:hypothetical protein
MRAAWLFAVALLLAQRPADACSYGPQEEHRLDSA